MRLEWIRCFNEVAKTGSITRAAQNLYITQPAVTKIIHALEAEVEETLFIRCASGVILTEQGKIFARFAHRVLKDHDQYLAEKSAHKAIASSYSGTIELVISPLLLQTYYQAISERIRQHFPQVNLCFVEADSDSALKLLNENPHMLGIILYAHNSLEDMETTIVTQELCTSTVVICTSKDSPYADLQSIDSANIPVEKLISVEFAKQSSQLPQGAFNAYTTNLEVIRQKLLSDDEVCVSIPQLIAAKKFASSHIVQLTMLDQKLASVGFFYNQKVLDEQFFSEALLKTFAIDLKAVILN